MTDHVNVTSPYYSPLLEESNRYGDMRFQELSGGFEFGMRYLNHVVFSFLNYKFDYMMRMDDDYFFCMERFLHELPVPMVPRFHWGWTHCIHQIVRPEESVLLFSRDLLQYFLMQDKDQLKCHPLADQMIGVWTKELQMNNLFRHDTRLHHDPVVSQAPALRTQPNLCHKYIGIHGCYADDMRLLWQHRGGDIKYNGNLISNSKICIKTGFNWKLFISKWRFEPKPCIKKTQWDTKAHTVINGTYIGRSE